MTGQPLKLPIFLALAAAFPLPLAALNLRVYTPVVHLRMNGFPANPVVNPAFLNPGGAESGWLDLTGVGWSVQNPTQQFTLVSPRHFVGANHFRPNVGSTVRFLARDNSLHSLTVSKITTIPNINNSPSDLFLGEFTADLPESAAVLPLPYLNLATEAAYVGEALVVAGQAARGGRGSVGSVSDFGGDPITGSAGITTRAVTFSYGSAGFADDAHAETGDSGSPSFAIRSGKAALVGTHTAVLSAFGTTTTYDTLVPHYAPALNTLMEATGLHMRKIDPSQTSLSVSGGVAAPPVRAGASFLLRISTTNGSMAADNVVANLAMPSGYAIAEIRAPGWFGTGPSTLRRGGFAAGENAELEISCISAAVPGSFVVTLGLESDGSALQSYEFPVTTLPSFASWASGLEDPSWDGDSDQDGIQNLIEYAMGGNNAGNSRFFPETDIPLLPFITGVPPRLSFLRRSDAAERGLHYLLETSDSLASASWQILDQVPLSVISNPSSEFERVEATLPTSTSGKTFYRLRVELIE